MQHYINNLITRLRQFSDTLDKKEIFIEIPWVIIDENQNQQKYIFKRNGDLVMSINGQATIGKWEYLSAAKSILIDRNLDKILLNQNFISKAVMVLNKDGFKDDHFILANEILLPDLNVIDYLKNLFYLKNNITTLKLKTGEFLELGNYEGWIFRNKVTIDGELVPDGFVELSESFRKLQIKNSQIIRVLIKVKHKTNKGEIFIEESNDSSYSLGDFVFQNNGPAPDGKYKLGFLRSIEIKNGRIIKS